MDVSKLWADMRVRVMLLVSACFLLGSTGWLMWLHRLTQVVPAAYVDVLTMGVGYLMQAAGLGVFAFAEKRKGVAFVRRYLLPSVCIFVSCMLPVAFVSDVAPLLTCGYLANVACGYFSGYYLLCLAWCVDEQARGVVFGVAYALATLFGWLLSTVGGGVLVGEGTGLLTCCFIGAAVVWAMRSVRLAVVPLGPVDHGQKTGGGQALVFLACATVGLMSITHNIGFGFPTTDLLDGVNVETSRLVYGAGLVLAGLVSDRDRRYGAICAAAALVTPFVMLSLSGAATSATIMWGVGYLLFSFFAVYRVLLLADLAVDLRVGWLAVLGLLVGRVGDALGTIAYVALGGELLVLIAVASAFFAPTMVLCFVLYQRLYLPESPQVSEREAFERFAASHDLSQRECEVLRLVLARRTNPDIAEELTLSLATVKFHVRNVLRKTGCTNRAELVALYRDESGMQGA